MMEIFAQLQSFLASNQIIGTVAGGSIVVWLVSNIKTIFFTVKRWVISWISFNINNLYEEMSYGTSNWKQCIFNQIITETKSIWERTINLDFKESNGDGKYSKTTYGTSIKIMYGKLCFISRSYETNNTKNNVHTVIQVFFARKKPFLAKIEADIAARVKARESEEQTRNFVRVYSGKIEFVKYKRSLDSIFTNKGEHYTAFKNIQKFIDNFEIYRKLNYPYKYCCCLHGKPGCGKSSTILAIASALNRNIRYINLSTVTSEMLTQQLSGHDNNRTLFVFEDIDALNGDATSSRVRTKKTDDGEDTDEAADVSVQNQICEVNVESGIKIRTLSLSDLLNITDGLLSNDGAICIFTTNHIERLDPAFLRAGRMNDIVEFEYLNAQTANKMLMYHLGWEVESMQDEIKPAELQEMILNIMTGHATKEQLIEKFGKADKK